MATLTRISVSTNQGSVVLTGNVDKPEEASRAEELARTVDGVREVVNNIKLSRTGG